jgi:histidinol-phosphate aminotransferase
MQRRSMLRQAALTMAAFTLSRDLFAREAFNTYGHLPAEELIRLGSNENPHGPSPLARKAMAEAVNTSNRYPWTTTSALIDKIAAMYGLKADNVVIGAGSSELLGLTAVMAALQKGNAVIPDPSFRLWVPAARNLGLEMRSVPLNQAKQIDLAAMKGQTDAQTRLIYICNPNNPTGTVIPPKELEAYIRKVPASCIVLLDEAYTEFSDEPSLAGLVNECPNLVVAKTFSKMYALAGARVGFALAHPQTIGKLKNLQPWANAGASAVSLAGALASVGDESFIRFCKKENAAARSIFCAALDKTGMTYIPSVTSFVYFNTDGYGRDVKALLESHNIMGVRSFEEGTAWRRLSIGTVAEMEKVAAVLKS